MGEQNALAQHPLEASREFDFRDSERMAQVQRTVHVRVGEVAKPFGIPLLYLRRCQTFAFFNRRSIDLEDVFCFPASLVLGLESLERVALCCLALQTLTGVRW